MAESCREPLKPEAALQWKTHEVWMKARMFYHLKDGASAPSQGCEVTQRALVPILQPQQDSVVWKPGTRPTVKKGNK